MYPYVSSAPYLGGYTNYPQNSPSYNTQPQMPVQQEPTMICRPVGSIEEARFIPTDFNGNLMILPDISHGMIHTKQLNPKDGDALFHTYILSKPAAQSPIMEPEPQPPIVEFAPLSEVEMLRQEISQLKQQLETLVSAQTAQDKSRTSNRGGNEK